jgi:hypothetical protein
VWSEFLHSRWGPHEKERIKLLVVILGVLERFLFTTLVGWNVPGAAGFIGAWIAVKVASGWATWPPAAEEKGNKEARAVRFIALCGSAMSAAFGIVGGIAIHVAQTPNKP